MLWESCFRQDYRPSPDNGMADLPRKMRRTSELVWESLRHLDCRSWPDNGMETIPKWKNQNSSALLLALWSGHVNGRLVVEEDGLIPPALIHIKKLAPFSLQVFSDDLSTALSQSVPASV